MNRRKFFGVLFGLTAVPSIIVKALSVPSGPILRSYPMTSKVRKLKATWSVELEQDLQHYHSNKMYAECTRNLSKQIQEEIDQKILENLI